MARTIPMPFKRRTREHVIASQSVNHVERFVIDAGHLVIRIGEDYGIDLVMQTFDDQGFAEPGMARLQLKASETLRESQGAFPFDLDVRDFNLWLLDPQPIFLILFDAGKRKAYWVHVQGFFAAAPTRRPRTTAKTIRILVPRRQVVNVRSVRIMREITLQVTGARRGGTGNV